MTQILMHVVSNQLRPQLFLVFLCIAGLIQQTSDPDHTLYVHEIIGD